MTIETLSQEDRAKVKRVIEEGIRIKQEIKDLNDGMKDVIKSVGTDLNIAPKILTKAINLAFKSSLNDEKEDLNDVEEVLEVAGRNT